MEKWFQLSKKNGITQAATKEEFYRCRVEDIVDVHVGLVGHCEVMHFRLRDGRIINMIGCEKTELDLLNIATTRH